MAYLNRTFVAAAVLTAGLACGAIAHGPAASATVAPPKPMNISASGGDNTTVEATGSQGKSRSSVEGTVDSDGDQDAFDFTASEEAKPQDKAPNRMTKS